MDIKSIHSQYVVFGPRHVTDRNRHKVLHTFESWEELQEYIFDPAGWCRENLGVVLKPMEQVKREPCPIVAALMKQETLK